MTCLVRNMKDKALPQTPSGNVTDLQFHNQKFIRIEVTKKMIVFLIGD